MVVNILESQVIDVKCKTLQWHSPHRSFYYKSYRDDVEKFAKGKDIVEIGCGVFGGLSEVLLKVHCNSYIGVDISVGDAKVTEPKFEYGSLDHNNRVPCVITIPEDS